MDIEKGSRGPSRSQMVDIVYGKLPMEDPVHDELGEIRSPDVVHMEDELAYYYPRSIESVVRKDDYRIQKVIKLTYSDERNRDCSEFQMLPDGRVLARGGRNSMVKIFEGKDYTERTLPISRARGIQMLPDGRILMTRGYPENFCMWEDKGQGYQEQRIRVNGVDFQMLPDGRIVIVSGKTLYIWEDKGEGYMGQELFKSDSETMLRMRFQMLPDGRVVTCDSGKTLNMWEDVGVGYKKQELPLLLRPSDKIISDFQMLPDGRIITIIEEEKDSMGYDYYRLSIWEDKGLGYEEREVPDLSDRYRINRFQILPEGQIVVLVGAAVSELIILDGDPV
ncbi:MAG: WD40 repeat domain-containing protein [Patescibacteria group bacterium]